MATAPDIERPLTDSSDGIAVTRAPDRPAAGAFGQRALWLLFVVVAAAGAYALFQQWRVTEALRTDVAQRLAAGDAAVVLSRAHESDLANDLRDAHAKLALLEARVAEFQSQQASLEALYRELAPSRDELALSEVEQILVLAGQQISLGGNVQAALAGLQVADAKLSRLDRPQLAPLRRALARDMDRLKAVPYVDVAGISIKLDQLTGAIDALPLAKDERLPPPKIAAPAAPESGWLRFLREVWADLHNVIRIEVSDRPAAPLVTPQQAFFLHENLRLRLLSARLALLTRDERAYKADIQAAIGWLKQYFDPQSKPVQAALATLNAQATVAMPGEMPDLAASIDAVRTLKAVADRTPERAAARAK
ncbi:MAG: uroporphyrinogen-III C-methyltransferase [Caldimonas sp.]